MVFIALDKINKWQMQQGKLPNKERKYGYLILFLVGHYDLWVNNKVETHSSCNEFIQITLGEWSSYFSISSELVRSSLGTSMFNTNVSIWKQQTFFLRLKLKEQQKNQLMNQNTVEEKSTWMSPYFLTSSHFSKNSTAYNLLY